MTGSSIYESDLRIAAAFGGVDYAATSGSLDVIRFGEV
jgi:hypothetical protein